MNSEKIKIILYTNIPGQEKVEFKQSLLYKPNKSTSTTDEYPYFSDNVEYPIDKLKQLSDSEMIDFFFNQKQFQRILKNEKILDKRATDYNHLQNECIEKNIKTMFSLLFPTGFPTEGDYHTSLDLIKGKQSANNLFKNPFSSPTFSYLKMKNTIYTIKSVIWLNDIFNHPEYSKLVEITDDLRKTCQKREETIKNTILQSILETSDIIDTVFEKMYEGIRISVSREPGNSVIISNGAAGLLGQLLDLQRIFLLSKGNSLQSIIEKQQKIIKSKLDNNGQVGDSITASLSKIIEDGKVSSTGAFIENQKSIIKKLEGLDVCLGNNLKSFVNENSNRPRAITSNDIKQLLMEINTKIRQAICGKKKFIKKQLVIYEGLTEFLEEGILTKLMLDNDETVRRRYNNFKNKLSGYKYPVRETSNDFLQNLINSTISETLNTETVKRYFNLLFKLNDYYLDNKGEVLNEIERQGLGVGICKINMVDKSVPRREICVAMDFIDGEVTIENKNTIFCPYTSESLGSRFEKLMDTEEEKNLLWSMDEEERPLFKVADTSVVDSKPSQKLEEKPVTEPRSDLKIFNGNRPDEKSDISELSAWFFSVIIPDKDTELETEIDNINKFSKTPFTKDELLPFLMSNNRELYSTIREAKNKSESPSDALSNKLIELRGNYNIKREQNENLLKTKFNIPGVNENERNRLYYEIELQKLYLVLVKYLVEFEKRKTKSGGMVRRGGRRASRKPVKKTLKYKLYSNISRKSRRN